MVLVPPLNFAMVAPGVYRSGHPSAHNFDFLRKLGLKTIVHLSRVEYDTDLVEWTKNNNIKIFQYNMDLNWEPFIEIEEKDVADALVKILDIRNHPVLVHCSKGRHRVGCLVGCLRRLQGWSMTSIFDEYRRFAGSKVVADQEFIEIFSEPIKFNEQYKPDWL